MRKVLFAGAMLISMVTISFADSSGQRTFTPTYAQAGGWSGSGAEQNFWAIDADGTEYCLGLMSDAAAKARYSTVLAAIAQGKTITIGIWALTSATIDAPYAKIWNIPEFLRMNN